MTDVSTTKAEIVILSHGAIAANWVDATGFNWLNSFLVSMIPI